MRDRARLGTRSAGRIRTRRWSFVARCPAVVAVVVVIVPASGCRPDFGDDDHICKPDEYLVKEAGPDGIGQVCVPQGKNPPADYVRYPQGQVPDRYGDTWDRYWEDHALDWDGRPTPQEPSLHGWYAR